MDDFDSSASPSSIQTEAMAEFSVFIDKLNPILAEIRHSVDSSDSPPPVQSAFDSLETDYNRAKSTIESQTPQPSPAAKQIEHLAQNLGRSLGLVLFAGHELPIANKPGIEILCREMMNVKFESNLGSGWGSEFDIEEEDEDEEEDEETERTAGQGTVEIERAISTVDEAVMEIKYGGDEARFREAILVLNGFVNDGMIINEIDEDVVKVLSNRLLSYKGDERVIIIKMLKHFVREDDQYKENMKDLEFLLTLVTSLVRDVEEQREAVGLLLSLSDDASVRRRIGRIPGCIVMLVAISNGDNQKASRDATTLLNDLSGNTQHALHMAEAGYFKPLIKYLNEGTEMWKVLMATALSRMELTDQNKASLGEDGAIEPLVKMFNTGNLEARLSALNALQSLSSLKQNIQRLIDTGIVMSLLQLLFSITSVLMTLREPASAILAKVAQSESILVKQDVAHQMLSLLNLSSPVIQNHLLEALNNIVLHASASKVRKKMKESGAIRLLVPFFTEHDTCIKTSALNLVYTLSADIQGGLVEQLGYPHVHTIANIVTTSTLESEKAAALGILSNFPVNDRKVTDILKNANILRWMVSAVKLSQTNSTPTTMWLFENISTVLIRFMTPMDKRLQHYSVEHGAVPLLLKLLSITSSTCKSNAALCLAQLSQNSPNLAKSRKLKWLCMPPSVDAFCQVHNGYCSVKGTFCLLKAGALTPLVQALDGNEKGADESILTCLSTLLQDDMWEHGCGHLVRTVGGVQGIIKIVASGSPKAKEKALWILERMFRVERYKEEYGEVAQVVLIDLAQNGEATLAPLVGKVLAQLELLQEQSSYF